LRMAAEHPTSYISKFFNEHVRLNIVICETKSSMAETIL
jgi:hypothetical protein